MGSVTESHTGYQNYSRTGLVSDVTTWNIIKGRVASLHVCQIV